MRTDSSEAVFRSLLGLPPGAGRSEIKKRYHLLARENHPDFFPPQARPLQELKMMALNEAYAGLMALPAAAAAEDEAGERGESRVPAAPEAPAAPEGAVALPRDPAYVYYKQGFLNYSRALHGIAAFSRVFGGSNGPAAPEGDRLSPRRFADSLMFLRRAHTYFRRVVEEYSDSIWCYDARIKLKRIGRFSVLYRRIVSNLRTVP